MLSVVKWDAGEAGEGPTRDFGSTFDSAPRGNTRTSAILASGHIRFTEQQLGSYRAWAMGQATAPGSLIQAQGSAAQPCLRGWVREMPSSDAGSKAGAKLLTPAVIGKSTKSSDYSCVPLCTECHTQAPEAYHRVGRRQFEGMHGLSFACLVARLNREWREARAA